MADREFIKVYADGEVEVNLNSRVDFVGDQKVDMTGTGDTTFMTIPGNSYSPTCHKDLDGKVLYETFREILKHQHFSNFDRLYTEQKGGE